MKIINEANEKFKDKQEELCGILFTLLRGINAIEKETYERSQELKAKKAELGFTVNQVGPGEKELWAEYKDRLGKIIKPVCTEKLIGKRYGGSYRSPQKYGYIDGECTVNFIMKTAKRAVVETHFKHGTDHKHKFVIRDIDGKWLLDEIFYGFESDGDKWYSDNIN